MAPTPPSQARARAARCAFTIACVFIVLLAFAAGDATSIAELEQELVRWLTNHGAELNAKIQRDGSGNRRLVASKPLSKGDIIISLPPKLPFCASCGVGALGAGTKADVGRQLLLERNKGAASFYKPLLDVLPWEEHWMELPPPMTAELMPPEMLPLLQHPRLEALAKTRQSMVRMVAMGDDWDDDGGGGSSSGPLPVAEVAFATAIFTSRAFALGPPGKGRHSYMLPLIDMGNHRANCTHALEAPEEWTPQSGKTLKLVAGADIKRGEEVCLHYKNLRNDEALLDYGFLLPDRPPLLCKVDHWEYAAAEGDSGGGAESMSTTTLGSAAATRTWHQVHVPADDVFPAESFEHFQTEIKRLNAIVETMAKTPKTTEVLASATRSLYASGKKRSALYLQGMSATARELLADFRGLRKLALRTTINQLHIDVADAMQDWLMNTDWMGGRNTEGDDAEDGRVEGGHAEGGHAEL